MFLPRCVSACGVVDVNLTPTGANRKTPAKACTVSRTVTGVRLGDSRPPLHAYIGPARGACSILRRLRKEKMKFVLLSLHLGIACFRSLVRACAHHRGWAAFKRPPLGGMGGCARERETHYFDPGCSRERFTEAHERVCARANMVVGWRKNHDSSPASGGAGGTVESCTL